MHPPEIALQDHFEALYAASDDPWDVRGTWYERRKRALLLASLGRERYRKVFEPGCGNGEMSAALAQRCDRLLACDASASAVRAARRRLHGAAPDTVRIERRSLPDGWPDEGGFDLVVVSELAYYFGGAALDALLARARASLAGGGELVLCHYLHDFDDRVTSTAAVHQAAARLPGLAPTLRHEDRDFIIEAWCLRSEAAP